MLPNEPPPPPPPISKTSSSGFEFGHHLRKNTPRDFPMIVRQAIEKTAENLKNTTVKPKIPRQNALLIPSTPLDDDEDDDDNSNQVLPPPPPSAEDTNTVPSELQTPSIENAPESIDFTSAVNLNLSNNTLDNNFVDDDVGSANETIVNDENNKNNINEVTQTSANPTISSASPNITLNLKNSRKNKKKGNRSNNSNSSNNKSSSAANELNTSDAINTSTEAFLNNINAMQLDDDVIDDDDDKKNSLNENKNINEQCSQLSESMSNLRFGDGTANSDINSNVTSKVSKYSANIDGGKDEEEDDEHIFKEFNSHQYWYISPDIPVDMDILLDPEEKSKFNLCCPIISFVLCSMHHKECSNDGSNVLFTEMRMQLEEELELRRFDRVKLPTNYNPKIVPTDLIKYFVSLAHSQDSTVVNYYCAYHFPAVVLTLGRK